MKRPTRLSGLLTLTLVVAPGLSGQAATLDEGSFVLEVAGRTVATETFTIRRAGFGASAQIIAQGTIDRQDARGRSTVRTALMVTGGDMEIRAYEATVTGAGDLRLAMTPSGNRLRAETRSGSGVEEREFRRRRGNEPVLVLDEGVVHLYYFLGRLASEGSIRLSVIVPQTGRQEAATLVTRGLEPTTVEGRTVQAQRLDLSLDGVERHVWIDAQNRVLRVEIPSIDFTAVRRELPTS